MLDRLFSPLAIGSVTIPNRIVSTSHQTSLVHHHLPTDELIAYHRARARGGAGLIVVEATAIHHTGLLTAHTLGGYLPEIVPAYRRLSEAVHEHDTRLFVQLFHGGREVISISSAPGRRGAVQHPQRPLQDRAARADSARDRRDDRRLPPGGRLRGGRRHRRRRGLRGLQLPAHPVPLPARQHPHRLLRRLVREPAAVPARGLPGHARGHRRRRRRLPADRRERFLGWQQPRGAGSSSAASWPTRA